MRRTKHKEFKFFNGFRMMKISLTTVLRISLRTCKLFSRNPCINRESKISISQFSYKVIVVTRKKKFLSVLTPPSIYNYQCRSVEIIGL